MRIDKLTSKFQEALADAQSLALGKDNAYIQPEHLLAAMLQQEDGPRALLQRAGVHVAFDFLLIENGFAAGFNVGGFPNRFFIRTYANY